MINISFLTKINFENKKIKNYKIIKILKRLKSKLFAYPLENRAKDVYLFLCSEKTRIILQSERGFKVFITVHAV